MIPLELRLADRAGLAWAQATVATRHYLGTRVIPLACPEAYLVEVGDQRVGTLIFGRTEAQCCYVGALTYGSLKDIAIGRAQHSRWCVLNLARVWLDPRVQAGGDLYGPGLLPGYTDRRGAWRSTLATTVIGMALDRIVVDYLAQRPPCFLDEPYEIAEVISYCNTHLHRGTIYRAAGFRLVHTNRAGLETWAKAVRPLTAAEDLRVRLASMGSKRSIGYRAEREAKRAQLELAL